MPPSVPTEDGPAVIVDSNGVVGVFEGEEKKMAATTTSGGVPGLLNDSISSASCTEHEAHANVSSSSDQQTGALQGPAANMEVMGIYKRGSVPRESELPEDYVLKDCQQDQVMVRQRLRTRPLFDDDDEHEQDVIDADSDSSDIDDDGDDGSEADDESGGGDQTSKGQAGSEKRKKKKKSKKGRLSRRIRRLLRTKADGTEYDVAMFQPEEGLVMKESDWPFFHADLSEHSDSSDDERVSSFALFGPRWPHERFAFTK